MATAVALAPTPLRLPTRVPVLPDPQLSEPAPPDQPVKRPRFAVIPTKGNRPEVLVRSVNAVGAQVQGYVDIVHNSPTDWLEVDTCYPTSTAWMSPDEPVNLSKMWNRGLDMAARQAAWLGAKEWDVAIINDDAVIPEGWFDAVSTGMRDVRGAAACSGPVGVVHHNPGPVPLHTRLQGYAFMLAGELGLRANEDIYWYFTDDYLDWESRKLGGMVMVQGFPVEHLHPNGQMTPEIHVQCAKDAQTFFDLYGMRPW